MDRHRRRCSSAHKLLLASVFAIVASIASPLQASTSHSLVLLVAVDQLQSHREAVLGSLPKLVGMLEPGDRFGAVIYSDVVEHVTPLATLTAHTLPDLKAALQRPMSANGVNGAVGFERALAALDSHSDSTGVGTTGTDSATLIGFSSLAITQQEAAVTQQFESWLEVSLMTQAMDRELRVLLLSGTPVSGTIQTLVTGTLRGRIVDLAGDASTLTPMLREYAAAPLPQTPAQPTAQPTEPSVQTAASPTTTAAEAPAAEAPAAESPAAEAPAARPPAASASNQSATPSATPGNAPPTLSQSSSTDLAASAVSPDSAPAPNDAAPSLEQPPIPIAQPGQQWTVTLLGALAMVAGTLIIGGLVYTRHKQRRLALEQTAQLRAQQLGHGYRVPERSTRPQTTTLDDTVIDKTEVLLPQRISDDSFEFMAEALNQTGRR